MRQFLVNFFYSFVFLAVWYYCFLLFLKFFANSPYFIFDDFALWFLFFFAYYHLEFVKKKH
uniref:Uncharacterized protein n=1 Tax=Trachydiscus minutus TaxID=1032745 RepID=A0A140F2R9_9STRA|nr:hypothetical protein [Trachydiscus minutus]AML60703.1 hypothetical protein [Trachydiscus minutus]